MSGIPYSTIRDQFAKAGVPLRSNRSVSSGGLLRQNFKNSAPPPYGFCYLDGGLHKDPREYPILQIIDKQRQRGSTPTAIAEYLNHLGKKTRTGKQWKQPTVYYIIDRLKTQTAKEIK